MPRNTKRKGSKSKDTESQAEAKQPVVGPRLFIKMNAQGQILAVSRVEALQPGQESPFTAAADEQVVEIVEATEKAKYQAMEVLDIHLEYEVDVKKKVLRKKAP